MCSLARNETLVLLGPELYIKISKGVAQNEANFQSTAYKFGPYIDKKEQTSS